MGLRRMWEMKISERHWLDEMVEKARLAKEWDEKREPVLLMDGVRCKECGRILEERK